MKVDDHQHVAMKSVDGFISAITWPNSISSVESQKGAINIQRCSIENQKGAIAAQSLWW